MMERAKMETIGEEQTDKEATTCSAKEHTL
jgi:hypothetical protein